MKDILSCLDIAKIIERGQKVEGPSNLAIAFEALFGKSLKL